jgi:hypothetical protein
MPIIDTPTRNENPVAKKKYESPELIQLGNVAELTND